MMTHLLFDDIVLVVKYAGLSKSEPAQFTAQSILLSF